MHWALFLFLFFILIIIFNLPFYLAVMVMFLPWWTSTPEHMWRKHITFTLL